MDFGREKEVFPLVLIQEGRVEKCTVLDLKNKREKGFLPFKTQLFHIQVVRCAASNFLLTLLAYMESATTHLTLTFISFCCIWIQSFKRILSLNALNERCSMNDMPSICILLTFAPNSTDLVSLPLTMRSLTFRPSNISFSYTSSFLMMERHFW